MCVFVCVCVIDFMSLPELIEQDLYVSGAEMVVVVVVVIMAVIVVGGGSDNDRNSGGDNVYSGDGGCNGGLGWLNAWVITHIIIMIMIAVIYNRNLIYSLKVSGSVVLPDDQDG